MIPSAEPVHIGLWHPDPARLGADLQMLGNVLQAAVNAGASVSFILPFSRDDSVAFWRDNVWPAVQAGKCCVLVARRGEEIVGTVQFDLATPPNQPHRAEIKKLLVHPAARRAGIARALMLALEEHAREAGRTLLTLDTASEGAERLYSSLGYVRVGTIPNYSRRPDSSEMEATTVMYKELDA